MLMFKTSVPSAERPLHRRDHDVGFGRTDAPKTRYARNFTPRSDALDGPLAPMIARHDACRETVAASAIASG